MSHRQRGVALAIVVWFLAAMSLLVAGIVSQARVDTRMAQIHVARAQASAAGDGAINLMLTALKTRQIKGYMGRGVPQLQFRVGDLQADVSLVPVGGLIDINGAPRGLLVALFNSSGLLEEGEAQWLADNVLKWRARLQPGSQLPARFDTIEDLLLVEGIGRSLFEKIRDSVKVGAPQSVGVDWMSAPEAVLAVLAGGDNNKVSAALAARGEGFSPGRTMPRGMNSGFQTAGSGNEYRVDAVVVVGDKRWLRRRWVSVDSGPGTGMLPWRYTRTEPVRAL